MPPNRTAIYGSGSYLGHHHLAIYPDIYITSYSCNFHYYFRLHKSRFLGLGRNNPRNCHTSLLARAQSYH